MLGYSLNIRDIHGTPNKNCDRSRRDLSSGIMSAHDLKVRLKRCWCCFITMVGDGNDMRLLVAMI
jgi:hypothetical protein